jgi:hypothetical protein
MLCQIRDRLRLTGLDPPPPSVRTDEGLDQRLVAARLPWRCRRRSGMMISLRVTAST